MVLLSAEHATTLSFEISDRERESFLARLIAAIRDGQKIDDARLPAWPADVEITLRRYGGLVPAFEVLSARLGHLHR